MQVQKQQIDFFRVRQEIFQNSKEPYENGKPQIFLVVQFPCNSYVAIAAHSGLQAILASVFYDVTAIDFAAKLI